MVCSTRPGQTEPVHVVQFIVYSANIPNTKNNQIYLNAAFRQRTDPNSRQKARLPTDSYPVMSPGRARYQGERTDGRTDWMTDRSCVVDLVFAIPEGRAGTAWKVAG